MGSYKLEAQLPYFKTIVRTFRVQGFGFRVTVGALGVFRFGV